MTFMRIASLSFLTCIGWGTAQAQAQEEQKQPSTYIYSTYFKCDMALQERADAIEQQTDQPAFEAVVADGTLSSWGWLAHHTGGQWRRAEYFSASSLETLLDVEKKMGDQRETKYKKLGTEFAKICSSHDDYIWKAVAGKGNDTVRGGASFSTYYVCDVTREDEADALIKQVFAPIFDKSVADGQLKSWGWNEHIVGGEYRRLATFTAADMPAVIKARSALVAALDKNPLTHTLERICGSHTDYMWEIKAEKAGKR